MNTFIERLEKRLNELDLNGAELSRRTGISKGLISHYRTGKAQPKANNIYLLAKALNVSEGWLMGLDVPMVRQTTIKLDNITLYNAPLFESVSAGFGAYADNNIVDYVPVMIKSADELDNTICIRVKGDSMSPKIEDGDIIQVMKQSSVDSGDIAVVLIDNTEGFVKKVEYDINSIRLISLNMNYPVVTLQGEQVQRCRVVGKVKRVMRDI